MKCPSNISFTILLLFTAILISSCDGVAGVRKSHATITFEDGKTSESSESELLTGGISDAGDKYSVNMGTFIFNAHKKEGIKEGDKLELNITVKSISKTPPLDEDYRSFYFKGTDSGEEGEAIITFNSINGGKV